VRATERTHPVDRAPNHTYTQRGKVALKRLLIVGALAAASAFSFTVTANAVDQDTPVGTVSADGDPAAQEGHVYADGNGANGAPEGYIGVNSSEGVVGCWTGDYAEGSNNVIAAIPPDAPTIPPNPGDPCAPSAP
jgi:hypothetical protein